MSELTKEQIAANEEFFKMGETETLLQDFFIQEHDIPMIEGQLQDLLYHIGFYKLREDNAALKARVEELGRIVHAIAENDLNDMASDCHTVGMVIQEKAKQALKEQDNDR